MKPLMGISIGQKRSPSAICVVERERRDKRFTYLVRHLERLPPQTPFPEIAQRAGELAKSIRRQTRSRPTLSVNATGLGKPVIDLFKQAAPLIPVVTVFLTHGDRRTEESHRQVTLGKALLVSQLQALLQARRLLLPESPEAEELARDLQEYEIQVAPDANERYGAFSIGPRDDQVTALGLAIQTRVHEWRYSTYRCSLR